MHVPTLFAADVVSDGSPITLGLGIGLLVVGIAWGESRWQISHLRELRAEDAKSTESLVLRVTALEVREGRMTERLDGLVARLGRIELKLDQLLERKGAA